MDDKEVDAEYAAWQDGPVPEGAPIGADFHAGWVAGRAYSEVAG